MKKRLLFSLFLAQLTLLVCAQTLVPYKDSWKYLVTAADPGTSWRSLSFHDGSWSSGMGKLGYGLTGLATTLPYGPSASQKYPTTYFRKTITLPDPALYHDVTGSVQYDDGVVVYVNGTEVYRSNLPAGTVTYSTLASAPANASKTFTLSRSAFVKGTNVLAVEVHQASLTNNDLAFDLRLVGNPDKTAPKVQSVTRLAPATATTNASGVTFRVSFSEKVGGVDVSDFLLTATTGTPTGTVSRVTAASGDGTAYDVQVGGISGSGVFRLDLKSTGTAITDVAGNSCKGYKSGQSFTIDRAAPAVVSVNRQAPAPALTGATSLTYRVLFSEAVTGVHTSDFALVRLDGTVAGTIATLTASGGAGTTYDVTVAPVTGSGNLRLDLRSAGTGIADLAGNHISGGFTGGQPYTVDQVLPQVLRISRLSPLGEITKASALTYQVVFSEKVTSVGATDFTVTGLNGTAKGKVASSDVDMVGTDGTTYNVIVSSVTGTGQLRLDLKASGTGIQDAAANACGGFSTGQLYSIDKTKPLVASIERLAPAATHTNGGTVTYRATFSEAVSGVDAADFSLTTVSGTAKGVIAPDALTPVGTTGTTYDIKVSSLTGNGQLRLNVKSSATGIVDVAANALDGGFTGGQSFTLDGEAPTVATIYRQFPNTPATNGTALTWRVTFSEGVSGVTPACFSLTTVEGTLRGMLAATSVTPIGTAGTTYEVQASGVTGTGIVRLDVKAGGTGIKDIATNALGSGFATGQPYTVDQTPPVVLRLLRQAPLGETTNFSSVVWRVTFSEKILGLDPADFLLTTLAGAPSGELFTNAVTPVGADGTTYDVRASAVTTFSTLRLDLRPGAALTDAVGNLPTGGYYQGQPFKVDPPPTVLSVDRHGPLGEFTNAAAVAWRVTFSEAVSGVDAADFTLTTLSGTPSGELTTVTPVGTGGAVYQVTAASLTTSEVLRLDLKSSGLGISDALGTPLSNGPSPNGNFTFSGFRTGQTYTVDKAAPTVTSVNRQAPTAAITNATGVTFRVTFSEAVTGVDPSDFVLTTLAGTTRGTLAPGAIVAVGTAGTAYDVTVRPVSGTGSLRLDLQGTGITDRAGNTTSGVFVTGQPYSFDYTPPAVLGISRLRPLADSAHGSSVTYRLLFSEGVTGVDPGDFAITTLSGTPTGRLTATAVQASGTGGTTYDVTISAITRLVTLRLDLKDSTGIVDAGGNTHRGYTSAPIYTIDPAPVVDSIVRRSPQDEVTSAADVTFRVYFSEKVKNVDPTDFFTTAVTGDVRGTLAELGNETLASRPLPVVAAAGTGGTTYDVSVHAITGTGTLRLDVKEGGTGIKDEEGEPLLGGFTGGQTYTIQQPAAPGFTTVTDLGPVPIAKNTADKPQGKLWYYAYKWWSVLCTPSGTKVFRLDGTTWTDVLTLSASQVVHADCRLVGNLVHILLFEPENDSYLVSVEYDADTDKYKLWSERKDRVKLEFGTGAESATLAIDGRGRMWVASAAKTDVNVRWSDAPYSNWSDTFRIAQGILDDDICAITTLIGKIGVLWSNQATQRFGFKTHDDGADPREWSADEEPASGQAQSKGNGFGDDHMNILCSSDGILYCAVKTSYDTPGYAKISLLKRTTSGHWSFYPVSSIEGTRGVAILNQATGKLRVVYCSKEEGGDIIYRETDASDISFGPPRTLISGRYLFNEATTSHQPNYGEVVILATNQDVEPKLAVGVIARDENGRPPSLVAPATAAEQEAQPVKAQTALWAYPNPAAGATTLRYMLPQAEDYRLVLLDARGIRIRELKRGSAEAGKALSYRLDGSELANGVYLVQLQAASGTSTVQLMIEK
ncbi:T9SS type A sorting domain-containing protein [Paraflavisolibacter sp. H34]|uniref:T9SS type A sorting domain-containing protein n=1 Tax=Huijunlia imazamoxiresistens TaxID=3127457 RepID=UPI003017C3D0